MNYLGLEKEKLNETVQALNILLADYHVYYQNLRNYHWNVKGENFFDLHEKFEELYNDARVKIDEIAERILILRYRPMSNMSDYLAKANVNEVKADYEDHVMVENILENHKILIEDMRVVLEKADTAKDEGTIDMIGGFLENIEKMSWMLDAWATQKVGELTA
jgi:starvation-inducible DNA-binding protein